MPVTIRGVAAAVAVALAAVALAMTPGGTRPAAPERTDFSFQAASTPADQQLFREAVAVARPEARRLIERVAGHVEVSFLAIRRGKALGVTEGRGGEYHVDIDVPGSMAAGGRRAVQRVVLHELGHVVDFALLDDALRAQFDAQMPTGYACPASGCADRTERFAETFAKWALGDIGASLYVGYAVPPPVVTLDRWGEPLRSVGL
jgi:hypothetical protein